MIATACSALGARPESQAFDGTRHFTPFHSPGLWLAVTTIPACKFASIAHPTVGVATTPSGTARKPTDSMPRITAS